MEEVKSSSLLLPTKKNSTRKGVVFFVAVNKTRTPVRKIAKGNSDE